VDLYELSVLIFLSIVVFFLYRDRKNIKREGLFLIRPTKKGIELLDRIAKFKSFWKYFGLCGVVLGLLLMTYGIISFVEYSKLLIEGIVKLPGFSFMFPSIKSEMEVGPGYMLVPFWFWLIIFIAVIFPHEIFHGIISRAQNVKIKSAGVLLLVVLPGAFVEENEKDVKKLKLLGKLKFICAGSFANFLVYLLILFLTANIIWPFFVPGPVVLTDVNATGPAGKAGLISGMVVTRIDNATVAANYEEYLTREGYISEEVKNIKPGDYVTVLANGTEFSFAAGSNPLNKTIAYFGITYSPIVNIDDSLFSFIIQALTLTWLVSFAVAVCNLLPIYPFDGEKIVEVVAEKIDKKHAEKIAIFISLLMLSILIFNFLAPFILK